MLSDTEIRHARSRGHLRIQHADEDAIQAASFDFHLGTSFARAEPNRFGHDPKSVFVRPYEVEDPNKHWSIMEEHHVLLNPGEFILAVTREEVSLDNTLYARVEGKSTLGRWGLLVHTTAGFIDPGFRGPITLELRNVGPFILDLYKDMKICQIAFGRVEGVVANPYSGHYQNQKGVGLPY